MDYEIKANAIAKLLDAGFVDYVDTDRETEWDVSKGHIYVYGFEDGAHICTSIDSYNVIYFPPGLTAHAPIYGTDAKQKRFNCLTEMLEYLGLLGEYDND